MARIILVEDDESIRETTEELLELLGHEVVLSAADGEAVQAALAAVADPDLAIIDLSLPDIEGDRLAARIVETFPGLGVIISSGRRLRPEDFDLGGALFTVLAKPYNLDSLKTAMATLGAACPPATGGKSPKIVTTGNCLKSARSRHGFQTKKDQGGGK